MGCNVSLSPRDLKCSDAPCSNTQTPSHVKAPSKSYQDMSPPVPQPLSPSVPQSLSSRLVLFDGQTISRGATHFGCNYISSVENCLHWEGGGRISATMTYGMHYFEVLRRLLKSQVQSTPTDDARQCTNLFVGGSGVELGPALCSQNTGYGVGGP